MKEEEGLYRQCGVAPINQPDAINKTLHDIANRYTEYRQIQIQMQDGDGQPLRVDPFHSENMAFTQSTPMEAICVRGNRPSAPDALSDDSCR